MSIAHEVAGRPNPAAETAIPAGRRTTPVRSVDGFGALLLRLHFYAGILVAPFLMVAAMTGLAYTFTPAARQARLRRRARVDGRATPARRWPSRSPPPGPPTRRHLASVIRPATATHTTQVVFDLARAGREQHTVYVDPYTGEVHRHADHLVRVDAGDDLAGRPAPQPAPRRGRPALLRARRELAVGASSSAAWCCGARAAGRGNRTAAAARPTWPRTKGVRRTRGWHAATGVWLALGLLLLSATGLTWSRYAGGNFGAALDALQRARPDCRHRPDRRGPAASDGGHHERRRRPARPIRRADRPWWRSPATPGSSGPVEVDPAGRRRRAWTVSQDDNTWPVGLDRVAVDPATGDGHRPRATSPTGRCWPSSASSACRRTWASCSAWSTRSCSPRSRSACSA